MTRHHWSDGNLAALDRYLASIPDPVGEWPGEECGRRDDETGRVCTGEIVSDFDGDTICDTCGAQP